MTMSEHFSFVRGVSLAGVLRFERARFRASARARLVYVVWC